MLAAFQLDSSALVYGVLTYSSFCLILFFPQKSQCFIFEDEEREERKVGTHCFPPLVSV